MGIIKGICISTVRGVKKVPVAAADIKVGWGIVDDAHGGDWHRQISLLSAEKIEEFKASGADVKYGDFGENLVVEGFDFRTVPVGSRFQCGEVILEITQIGKECHTHCAIYQTMGDCIMPREGVFAKVIASGHIRCQDEFRMMAAEGPQPYRAAVITLSDSGYEGRRKDESGPAISAYLKREGYEVVEELLLPDEQQKLENQLIRLTDRRQVQVIFTTGGTGFSQRDVTPEATINVCDRMTPGIAEAIRNYSMTITRRAMFSRGAAGLRHKTLIINLPGSPKAVRETLAFLLPELPHGLDVLVGISRECARK